MSERHEPPAFQFYVADWLSNQKVRCMTHPERGAYIDLLCFAWRDGSIPADFDQLARLLGTDPITVQEWWVAIGPCWVDEEHIGTLLGSRSDSAQRKARDTRLYNFRMEKERRKLLERRERAVSSGRAGAQKRWLLHGLDSLPSGGAIATPIGNDSSAVASTIKKTSKEKWDVAERVLDYHDRGRKAWVNARSRPTTGRTRQDTIKLIVKLMLDDPERWTEVHLKLVVVGHLGAASWWRKNDKTHPRYAFRDPVIADELLDAGQRGATGRGSGSTDASEMTW